MPDVEEYYRQRLRPTERNNLRKAMETEENEYELNDILEEVTHRNIVQVVQNNIEFVLRREGLLSPDMRVIIAEGGYDYDLGQSDGYGMPTGDLGHFYGDFTIYDRQGSQVAGGDASGTIAFDPPELLDLNVRIMEVF